MPPSEYIILFTQSSAAAPPPRISAVTPKPSRYCHSRLFLLFSIFLSTKKDNNNRLCIFFLPNIAPTIEENYDILERFKKRNKTELNRLFVENTYRLILAMPMVAAGPAPPLTNTMAAADPVPPPLVPVQVPAMVMTDAFAKDAIIAWFRGEFAAANAIIDALCGHLAQVAGGGDGAEYEAVFASIHQRRLNWIPVIQMQKYHSIADVIVELKKVAAKKAEETEKEKEKSDQEVQSGGSLESAKVGERVIESKGKSSSVAGGGGEEEDEAVDVVDDEDDSPDSDITNAGLV